MRIALLIATVALGLKIAIPAYATVNELQEKRAEQFCQIDPNYCNGK